MKPIETSSVLEEADDQSVPNTTMPSTFNTTSISSTEQSSEETKKSVKKARLKSCIIKLTELSNSEREKWATSENSSPKLNNSIDSTESLNSSGSRYNMRSRPTPTPINVRPSRRKRTIVNYKEQMMNDSGHDSDFEPILKPQPPLDNKSYPTPSRMAI